MLYIVTNRSMVKNNSLLKIIEASIKGGADAVILREKDLSHEQIMSLSVEIKNIIENTNKNVRLIINRNLKAAKEAEAWGYHTGYAEFMQSKPNFNGAVGVSVHSVQEAADSHNHGAHYLLAGHIFQTSCKQDLRPRGVRFIKDIKSRVNIPVIAIGGITPENVREVIGAGAEGIALMSSVMTSKDPCKLTREFKEAMLQA